jgi:hypothetical protein
MMDMMFGHSPRDHACGFESGLHAPLSTDEIATPMPFREVDQSLQERRNAHERKVTPTACEIEMKANPSS